LYQALAPIGAIEGVAKLIFLFAVVCGITNPITLLVRTVHALLFLLLSLIGPHRSVFLAHKSRLPGLLQILKGQ
jgi:hypothetical protein